MRGIEFVGIRGGHAAGIDSTKRVDAVVLTGDHNSAKYANWILDIIAPAQRGSGRCSAKQVTATEQGEKKAYLLLLLLLLLLLIELK